MRIIPLSEGSYTIDRSKEFVPFNKHFDDLQERPIGSLLVEIQPFVVETTSDIILMDCGLGFCDAKGVMNIHFNLMQHQIDPSQVTKVLLSHLHKDHAGGALKFDVHLQQYSLSFPNATYYINRNEMHYALEENQSASYQSEKLTVLQNSNQVVLLDDIGSIDQYIKYQVTGAHSKFHQVFWIEEEGDIIFYGGDDAPQLKQMKVKFVAKYDFDGTKSMTLRNAWWQKGKMDNWTFLFYHDIQTPTFSDCLSS